MDARVRHQVGLELGEVDVQLAVETEGGSDGGNALGDEAVEVGVRGSLDVEVAAADVVQGLVVDKEGDVRVLEHGVRAKDRVVRLDNNGGDLRGRVDGELNLGLLAVVDGETVEEEGAEAGACAAAEGVEDHEALETRAVVGELADAVEDEVNDLLADGVVATGVVVGGVLLARDELLRVVQVAVRAGADLVDASGLKVNMETAGHELAGAGLREEGVEGVVIGGGVLGLLSVGLDAVLKAEKLPASVSGLDTSLAKVNKDDLAHVD
mmetsp:Transcript_27180/g.50333  ORF Transcript_27180/g.50333 Transcript_27180/m.50333 type:complete len:267 (+) Transcript_27180:933-1733(+)